MTWKALIIAKSFGRASERWLDYQIDLLNEHIVGLVTHYDYGHPINYRGHQVSTLVPNGSKRSVLNFVKSGFQGKAARQLQNLTKTLQPDVVIVHYATLAVDLINALKQLSVPVFICGHGYDICWKVKTHDRNRLPIHSEEHKQAVLKLSHFCHYVVASSWSENQLLTIGIHPQRILLKPFSVPLPTQPSYPTPGKVVYLGRLIDFKGPIELIEAIAICRQSNVPLTLSVLGDGPLMKECQRRTKELNISQFVQFHGAASGDLVDRELQSAWCLSGHHQIGPITGQEEAFGVALIEAMAHGVPIVTGRSGGIADTVKDNVNGRLFTPGDIQTHAQILCELFRNPSLHNRLSTNARKTISDKFLKEHEYNRWCEIAQSEINQTSCNKH